MRIVAKLFFIRKEFCMELKLYDPDYMIHCYAT